MIQINFSKYQAIVTRSAIVERLPEYRESLAAAPGSVRGMYEGHIKAMEEALAELNEQLSSVGVEPEVVE